MHLAIVLLYTTGLRRRELLRLIVRDYDQKEGTLLIRESKFHKSRVLPLHQDIVEEINRYLQLRRERRLPMSPEIAPDMEWEGRWTTLLGARVGKKCKNPPQPMQHSDCERKTSSHS